MRDFQITGAPGWVENERFDLEAKADGQANQDDFKVMMQAMLADRFKLKLHRDTKDMGVYNLGGGQRRGSRCRSHRAKATGDNAQMRMGRGRIQRPAGCAWTAWRWRCRTSSAGP